MESVAALLLADHWWHAAPSLWKPGRHWLCVPTRMCCFIDTNFRLLHRLWNHILPYNNAKASTHRKYIFSLRDFFSVFICPKESILLSDRFMLFSPIKLKFFLGFSCLPTNEMTNNLCVCVIWWFCDSVIDSVVSSFLYLNMFQSAPNLVHTFLNAIPRDGFLFFSNFQFLRFLLTFSVFWDLAIFWGENQTTSKSNFYGFYGINGPF